MDCKITTCPGLIYSITPQLILVDLKYVAVSSDLSSGCFMSLGGSHILFPTVKVNHMGDRVTGLHFPDSFSSPSSLLSHPRPLPLPLLTHILSQFPNPHLSVHCSPPFHHSLDHVNTHPRNMNLSLFPSSLLFLRHHQLSP